MKNVCWVQAGSKEQQQALAQQKQASPWHAFKAEKDKHPAEIYCHHNN